jgi:hypothetical protein
MICSLHVYPYHVASLLSVAGAPGQRVASFTKNVIQSELIAVLRN